MRFELLVGPKQRWGLGVALPLAFLGLLVVPPIVYGGDLPSPIAIHFDVHGTADGTMTLGAHLALIGLMLVPSAAVLVAASWRPSAALGIPAAVAAFLGATVGIVNVLVLHANSGLESWEDATLGGDAIVMAVAVGLFVGLPLVVLVGRAIPPAPRPAPVRVVGSERVAWFGSARSSMLAGVAVLMAAVGVVLLFSGPGVWPAALIVVVVSLVMVVSMNVEVSVSNAGLSARPALVPWPRVSFGLEEIRAVQAVDVDPLRGGWWNGGWGYRGSLRLAGKAAWMLRKGPAIQLDLVGDRTFLVTVDDAEEGAAVLAGLLDRAEPAGA